MNNTKNQQSGLLLKRIILSLLLLAPASLLVLFSLGKCEHKFQALESYGQIPTYTLTKLDGSTFTNKDLKDTVTLYNTLQINCPDSCGLNLWYFNQIMYQHVIKNQKKLGHVKIVSILIDQQGNPVSDIADMQEILNDYVENYDPKVWIIATGDPKQVFDITHNKQNLIQEGPQFYGGKSYFELMLLVDKDNELRMALNGGQEGMIREMKQKMALLDKQYDLEKYKRTHKK